MTSADCFFSSTDDLSDIISKKILNAKSSILLAMYTLSNIELIKSLISVKKTGVQIFAIFDEEQLLKFNKIILELNNHDILFRTVGNSFARMHHKFLVIDDEITITGSFNWTFQANRKNEENLVIINGKSFSKKYTAEFDRIWKDITQRSVFEQLKSTEQKDSVKEVVKVESPKSVMVKYECPHCKKSRYQKKGSYSSTVFVCTICGRRMK
jgi:mitochondrial cardiolipin hydrolase